MQSDRVKSHCHIKFNAAFSTFIKMRKCFFFRYLLHVKMGNRRSHRLMRSCLLHVLNLQNTHVPIYEYQRIYNEMERIVWSEWVVQR